jgi:hypothetical protein
MEKKTQSTSAKLKVKTKNKKLIEQYFAKIKNANNGKHNDPKSTGS